MDLAYLDLVHIPIEYYVNFFHYKNN
jgi:hypothetical protein